MKCAVKNEYKYYLYISLEKRISFSCIFAHKISKHFEQIIFFLFVSYSCWADALNHMYTYKTSLEKQSKKKSIFTHTHTRSITHNSLFPLGRKCYLFIPSAFLSISTRYTLHMCMYVCTCSLTVFIGFR